MARGWTTSAVWENGWAWPFLNGPRHCPAGRNDGGSTAGPRQFGSIVSGVFTPVLAKHSKSFSLIDCISVGVDRMQRNVEPMRKQVEAWQRSELTDVTAKVVIYEAFVEGKLEAAKHLARTVHDLYFLCGAEIYVASASGTYINTGRSRQ